MTDATELEQEAEFIHARLRDNGYEVPEMEVWHALVNWRAMMQQGSL